MICKPMLLFIDQQINRSAIKSWHVSLLHINQQQNSQQSITSELVSIQDDSICIYVLNKCCFQCQQLRNQIKEITHYNVWMRHLLTCIFYKCQGHYSCQYHSFFCYLRFHNFSIKMADAPPPPLQIAAIPNFPGARLCTKCPVILVPDILKKMDLEKVFTCF